MFGLAEKNDGVPVLQDEAVIEAMQVMRGKQALVETLETDERRLLRVLSPLPNTPDPGDAARDEAIARLDVRKGTQNAWHLPELAPARGALKDALADLQARRAEAVQRLDTIRREARKPLVREWVSALEALLEAREAVLRFDSAWDFDRNTVQPGVERTLLEPVVSADSVDNMKQTLKAQGWL